MLLLCFFGVRLVMLASTAIFQLPFTISCSAMLSFAFVCFDLVAYCCRLAVISCGFLKQLSVAYVSFGCLACGGFRIRFVGVCFGFLECGGFCIRFVIGCCCLFRFLPFVFVVLLSCALPLVCIVCWWAVRSQSYMWVFHAMSHVVSVNKQMAHSQIVVVIAFSLGFEMGVALVLHRRPLGNVCFRCRVSIAVTII